MIRCKVLQLEQLETNIDRKREWEMKPRGKDCLYLLK